MNTFAIVFIGLFILAQAILGVVLLYHGFKLLLEELDEMQIWSRITRSYRQMLADTRSLSPATRSVLVMLLLFVPGSLPVLFAVALWRAVRNYSIETLY